MAKKLILVFLCFLALSACQGTETTSPISPADSAPGPRKIDTPDYQVVMDLPSGWTFQEFDETHPPASDAFTDIDTETLILALLKKEQTRLTFFGSALNTGETLESFIRYRHPVGNIESIPVSDVDVPGLEGFLYISDVPGPHGGLLSDTYIGFERDVLWIRWEIVAATRDQAISLTNEVKHIFDTFDITPKL